MEEKILSALKLRPSTTAYSNELLQDLIVDTVTDVKDYINYSDKEEIPAALYGVIKELVLFKLARLGSEGISSQQGNEVSENFLNDIPLHVKKKLYRYRKLFRE